MRPAKSARLTWAIEALRRGEVVALPTETVWGLAARADLPEAVRRVFELKGRPEEKPLTLFVPDGPERYAHLDEPGRRLWEALVPGPVTLIFRAKVRYPGCVKDGKVGLRVPRWEPVLELLSRVDFPLATTSANPSGKPPARSREELEAYFPEIPALDGEAGGGEPSTVLDAVEWVVLRRGPVSLARIEKIAGRTVRVKDLRVLVVCTGGVDRSPRAAKWLREHLGLEARFAGTLWPPEEVAEAARWADLVLPMEEAHREFLLRLGVEPEKVLEPLGVPDPHGLDEETRARIFSYMEMRLWEVSGELKKRLA